MAEDKELATALKQAKTKPMFFALVSKGAEGKLVVDKKKIPAKAAAELKKECGGGITYKGRCKGEEGAMIFEVGKEVPGALAALTKKLIKKDAGLALEVEYRVAEDLAADEDEGNEVEASEDGVGGSVEATSPPSNESATRFATRLKTLMPALQKIEAANKAVATQAKAQVADGNKAYLAKQYDDANAALDRAENLIKHALAPVTTKSPTEPSVDGAAVTKRLNGLASLLKTALAGPNSAQIQQLFASVNGHIKSKDFVKAESSLDELEAFLAASALQTPTLSLVKLGKARIEWNTARLHAAKEFQRLKSVLQTEYADNEEAQKPLQKALKRIDSVISTMNEELGNALDQVLNAEAEKRPAAIAAAKTTLKRFVEFSRSDELLSAIDGNELAPDMEVAGPLRIQLREIASSLG